MVMSGAYAPMKKLEIIDEDYILTIYVPQAAQQYAPIRCSRSLPLWQ